MSSTKIIFAGFGGQGVLSMGKFLAYAAIEDGLKVSWLPSYGPEMRGGTANCFVVISDEEVGSPVVTKADAIVVMNKPSLDKFQSFLREDGLLILDSDMIGNEKIRNDINIIKINAQTEAEKLGDKRNANMILLGALIEKTKVVTLDAISKSIKEHGKETHFNINKQGLELGATYIRDLEKSIKKEVSGARNFN